MSQYVAAIDQGTTSSRCMIFDHDGPVVAVAQKEHQQIFPRAGWVEHDPDGDLASTPARWWRPPSPRPTSTRHDIAAVGITNQRETTVVWDRRHRQAGVQRDRLAGHAHRRTRATELAGDEGPDRYQRAHRAAAVDLFLRPEGALDPRQRRRRPGAGRGGRALLRHDRHAGSCGTSPAERHGARHRRHQRLPHDADGPADARLGRADLRRVRHPDLDAAARSAARPRSTARRSRARHAAPACRSPASSATSRPPRSGRPACRAGEAKNTYGTGNFLLLNTGTTPVPSEHGLLTTVCYRIGDAPAVYALEGSVAVTGSLVQWLRDNLGIIESAKEIEELAQTVDDNGGAYFVPAFSGLFAPRWRPDARGAIVGLTRFVNKGHLARAALEATAFQTREVIEAMRADSGVELAALKVDGGMVVNETLMQFQSDILGVPVIRPVVNETTALGAAYAAGLAVGFWASEDDIRDNWAVGQDAGNPRWTRPSANGSTASGTRRSSGPTTGSTEPAVRRRRAVATARRSARPPSRSRSTAAQRSGGPRRRRKPIRARRRRRGPRRPGAVTAVSVRVRNSSQQNIPPPTADTRTRSPNVAGDAVRERPGPGPVAGPHLSRCTASHGRPPAVRRRSAGSATSRTGPRPA